MQILKYEVLYEMTSNEKLMQFKCATATLCESHNSDGMKTDDRERMLIIDKGSLIMQF
jgi:hypothetical protein